MRSDSVDENIFIPKYYDPSVGSRLLTVGRTRNLFNLGALIDAGHVLVQSGHEVGKMAYGTGSVPFVRTSDLANWEIKTEPKQGVGDAIRVVYAGRQDVQPDDILFVRDGTYLIGTCAMVTEADLPMLYQSHLLRFRVAAESPISAPLLLAALSSPIVRRQVRSRQFTADIIDTIGNRYRDLMLPVPKEARDRRSIESQTAAVVRERVKLREELRSIPHWAQGLSRAAAGSTDGDGDVELRNLGFVCRTSDIAGNTFIPHYYDPAISDQLRRLRRKYELISLGDLVESGKLLAATGIEVGKMAYGTGPIPFIRTSDMSNWELKGDPKQRVSVDLYESLKSRTDVRPRDIFVVRDGTYLVGSTAIVGKGDSKVLYCGGMYKLRLTDHKQLDPYLVLAMLNTPIVRQQMRAKQFTRDIIDTLGKRLFEVIVPIPRDARFRAAVADETRRVVERRAALRDKAKRLATEIEGAADLDEDEHELIESEPF
jgi:hypothetical protein